MSIERKPLTKNSSIILISKAASPDGKLDTPMGPGVLEKHRLPTLGIPVIHGALKETGFRNVISIDTQYSPRGLLTKDDWKKIANADAVGTTSITRNAPPTSELVSRIRLLNPKGTIFMGGFHASVKDVDQILNGADFVVRGEGYKTIVEAMESLVNNGNLNGIKGTTHKAGGEIVREDPRPLLTVDQLVRLPKPIYGPRVLLNRDQDTFATSIGCPFSCNFCSVTDFYGGTYRRLPNDVIINSLKEIIKREPTKPVFIIDDNFYVNTKATKELLKDMISSNVILPEGSLVQIRESAGADPEFLSLMYKVGIRILNVGIESINDEALKEMNKGTTSDKIKKNIEAMRKAGFWIHGMFIVGFDADTRDDLRELLDWAKSNVHSAQFFPPIPLPGTPDTIEKEMEGRILSKQYHLYDGSNVLIQPKNFTPWELQQIIISMYREFYSYKRLGYLDPDALPKKDSRYSYSNLSDAEVKKMLLTDFKVRLYADWTLGKMLNDPGRREHFKALKGWRRGQKI